MLTQEERRRVIDDVVSLIGTIGYYSERDGTLFYRLDLCGVERANPSTNGCIKITSHFGLAPEKIGEVDDSDQVRNAGLRKAYYLSPLGNVELVEIEVTSFDFIENDPARIIRRKYSPAVTSRDQRIADTLLLYAKNELGKKMLKADSSG